MPEFKHIFKRKIYDRLRQWKMDEDGHTAVMIEGARRVGKSTIAEEFAKNEYESYLLNSTANCYPTSSPLILDTYMKMPQHKSSQPVAESFSIILFLPTTDIYMKWISLFPKGVRYLQSK